MQSKKASFKDLLEKEAAIEHLTKSKFAPYFGEQEKNLDALLRISYLKPQQELVVNSAEYFFYFSARCAYYEVAHSFRSCSLLMEKGYYNEALSICRQLLENVVKLKYFFAHKDQFEAYAKEGKDNSGKRIQIGQMWDHVAGVGSYAKIYKFLSKLTHKNVETVISRLDLKQDRSKSVSLLPEYSEKYAVAIINNLIYIMYTYLKLGISLTDYTMDNEESFILEYEVRKKWLSDQINKRDVQFHHAKVWTEIIEKIVKI